MEETLTKENYVTNHDYLSYSRISRFIRCEAAAAVGFHEPTSTSQLIGSYVDAYFSNELEEFKSEHLEIFNSRTGELKSDFKMANQLISRIESDELFMHYLSGEKQKIMTGKIDGIKFKIKMDSYLKDEAIVDLKVMKDFKNAWSDAYHCYVSFVEAYDYDIEMAIFQEIVYQNTGKRLPCYLACITKEDPSDIGIFEIPQNKLNDALQIVKNNLPRIRDILDGKIAPHRCETCSYCRATKKARVLNFELAGSNGDKLREEGIECENPKIIKGV
jgi:hypothetical protein